MNEHGYVRAVTKQLKPQYFRWKINDPYQGGVPDMFFEGTGRDLWIEFKYIKKLPKKDSTVIDLTHVKYLSKLQQLWLERRETIRRDTLVIVGSEHGGVIFQGLEWQRPITAGCFVSRCLSHKNIAGAIENLSSLQ